jgi:hypothetical protein
MIRDDFSITDLDLRSSSVADPGSGVFLTPGSGIRDPGWVESQHPDPGSGMGRKSASGSGIRDEQPGSYFLELRNHFLFFFLVKMLKFFDADPGFGMETVRIRDPGWKKVGSGINIPDPQHCDPGVQKALSNIILFKDCALYLSWYERWEAGCAVGVSKNPSFHNDFKNVQMT